MTSPPPRIARRRSRGHPTSVLTVTADCPRNGEGRAPSWVREAIRQIVTLYTRPNDRIQFIAPPTSDAEGFTQLLDVAQSVSRRGRPTEVRTVASLTNPSIMRTAQRQESESDSGPRHHEESVARRPLTRTHPDPGDTDPRGPDRHSLVLMIAGPEAADWADVVPWDRLLTPTGVLAAITHSSRRQGRLMDPEPLLMHLANQLGLALLDRLVIVSTGTPSAIKNVPLRRQARQAYCGVLLFSHPREARR
ncbi:hypothetical protein [Streptomyces millisiae]|uniref:Nitroreductase domain-containing protein n=1 Tax=Streptomyces millisiae TaxID=3075542 RepID=A0ABU2LMT2_9ACTN|nr:hypothetical protein [Streptomyces sp. DSM 44918]MDT0318573.1 hypothetical protein [Streptomyces sp. DSM 44918]